MMEGMRLWAWNATPQRVMGKIPNTLAVSALTALVTGFLFLRVQTIEPIFTLGLLAIAIFAAISVYSPLTGLLSLTGIIILLEDIPTHAQKIKHGEFHPFYRLHLPLAHFTALELMLLVLVVVVIIRSQDHEAFLPKSRFIVPLVAFMGCAIGGVIYSALLGTYSFLDYDSPATIAINEFRPLSYVPLVCWLFYKIVRSQKQLRLFVETVGGLLLIRAVMGVFRYFMGIGFLEEFGVRIFLGDELFFFVSAILFMTARLQYAHMNIASAFLLGIGLTLMGFCLLFSFVREWEVGVLFGLGLLFFRWTPQAQSRTKYWAILLSLGGALVIWTSLLQMDSSQAWHAWKYHSFDYWQQSYSFQYRWIETKNAIRTWWENPLFGVGMGGRWQLYEYLPRLYRQTNTHNFYAFILLHLGVTGFAIFAWFFRQVGQEIDALRVLTAHRQMPENEALLGGTAVSLQTLALVCITGPSPTFSRSAIWIGLLLGILAALRRIEGSLCRQR